MKLRGAVNAQVDYTLGFCQNLLSPQFLELGGPGEVEMTVTNHSAITSVEFAVYRELFPFVGCYFFGDYGNINCYVARNLDPALTSNVEYRLRTFTDDGSLVQDTVLYVPPWAENVHRPFVGIPCQLAHDQDADALWVRLGYNDATAGTRLMQVSCAGPFPATVTPVTDDLFGSGLFYGCLPLLVYGSHVPAEPVEGTAASMQQCGEHTRCTPDPINTRTGNFQYQRVDLTIPGRGPAPRFIRSYNSLDDRVGPMGPGWTHNYVVRLRSPGDGTRDLFYVRENGQTDRYTYNPDGTYTRPPAVQATLVENADGSFTATLVDQTVLTFDSGGNLKSIRDRYGNESFISYNAAGDVAAVTDPAGRGAITFDYDPTTQRLIRVTDWTGRSVHYTYEPYGRLQTVTDRTGSVTTFAYDGASQRLLSITDANDHVAVMLTYDNEGRVVTQKDARGLVTGEATSLSYVMNTDGTQSTTITYPKTSFEPAWNFVEIDTYDAQGRLTQHVAKPTATAADDITVQYGYDANGFRDEVIDGLGKTTRFCYDVDYTGAPIAGSRGLLTRVISPSPDGVANPLVTLYKYDSKHNLTQVIPPKGVGNGSSVNCSTNLSGVLNTTYATDLTYDAATQTKLELVTRKYTDPDLGLLTAVTKFEYGDAQNPGLVTKVIPPRGNTGGSPDYTYATTFAYFGSGPKAGLLQSVTDPVGNQTTYDYDAAGRRTSMVDPNGNAPGGVPSEHTWNTEYDAEDRVRFVRAPAPVAGGSPLTTEFRYDAVGNRITVIDANGQVTRYFYDERDSLATVQQSPSVWTNPAVTPSPLYETVYQYDHVGNLTRVIRASGDATYERVVDYAYDGLNRLRRETQYPSWPTTTPTLVTTV